MTDLPTDFDTDCLTDQLDCLTNCLTDWLTVLRRCWPLSEGINVIATQKHTMDIVRSLLTLLLSLFHALSLSVFRSLSGRVRHASDPFPHYHIRRPLPPYPFAS